MTIAGHVAPGYERVRDSFAANFERRDDYREVGAALVVYRGERVVVDLWGGFADRARTRPWRAETLVNVYSTTKGIVAALAAILCNERRLDYGDRVTRHWPEFGQAGKESATVAHVLSHQAGLPGFREPTTTDDLYDWERCCAALARQAPCWNPGEGTSYHAMTFGYLAGEILRRAAGASVGRLVKERIAGPLGADLFIGLSGGEDARVAEMLAPLHPPDLSGLVIPETAMMALVNPQLDPEIANDSAWRAAEIPAANGHASARGIARLYAALANGGTLDGTRLCSADAIERMTEVQSPRRDLLLGFEGNWALGVSFNAMSMLGPDPQTFGHMGWGGSFGCANRERNVAIGYVCNQMGAELVGDPRARALCETIFASL